MPYLPPPSSEAVAALVKELRSQLGMALFGVDVIINIHTHTLTVIDINIFPGSTATWRHVRTRVRVYASVFWPTRPLSTRLRRRASVFLLPARSHQVSVEKAVLRSSSACRASRSIADSCWPISQCLRAIKGCCVHGTNGITGALCWDHTAVKMAHKHENTNKALVHDYLLIDM